MSVYAQQLQVAEEAAREAGRFLRKHFDLQKQVDAEMAHDIKLRLDQETQQLIAGHLKTSFPAYAFLGEEGGEKARDGRYCWVVDPIDGTVNYFYGLPLFCISIALLVQGHPVLGCVYAPMLEECFCAEVGGSPMLNGKPIHVSSRCQLSEAILFVGHGVHDGSGEEGVRRFARLSSQVRKMRILGTAALTLCYLAAGRMDGYVEDQVYLWDIAAAWVILEAAGGILRFTPSDASGLHGAVVAWNGTLPLPAALNSGHAL